MHTTYNFHFLNTVSQQLVAALAGLPISRLDTTALAKLAVDQSTTNHRQGVYVLYLAAIPVYLGKANNIHNRLRKHLRKLSGRKNIEMAQIGYKAVLLDKSMSTAANEDVLIRLFREQATVAWNGGGFGPNDPGRKRDTTEPGQFDRDYPIETDFPIPTVNNSETVASLFEKMKSELPYVFRHKLTPDAGKTKLNLTNVPRTAAALFRAAVEALEPGWQGAILSYGMVLYKEQKTYPSQVTVIQSRQ